MARAIEVDPRQRIISASVSRPLAREASVKKKKEMAFFIVTLKFILSLTGRGKTKPR
jgi:hypothetical protein